MQLIFSPSARTDAAYIQQLSRQVALLVQAFSDLAEGLQFSQSPPPTPLQDQGILWVANASGTLNGQTYAKGDLLYTANSGGTQKTIRIVNWSMF